MVTYSDRLKVAQGRLYALDHMNILAVKMGSGLSYYTPWQFASRYADGIRLLPDTEMVNMCNYRDIVKFREIELDRIMMIETKIIKAMMYAVPIIEGIKLMKVSGFVGTDVHGSMGPYYYDRNTKNFLPWHLTESPGVDQNRFLARLDHHDAGCQGIMMLTINPLYDPSRRNVECLY